MPNLVSCTPRSRFCRRITGKKHIHVGALCVITHVLPSCRVFLNGKVHVEYRKVLNTLFTRKALGYVIFSSSPSCPVVAFLLLSISIDLAWPMNVLEFVAELDYASGCLAQTCITPHILLPPGRVWRSQRGNSASFKYAPALRAPRSFVDRTALVGNTPQNRVLARARTDRRDTRRCPLKHCLHLHNVNAVLATYFNHMLLESCCSHFAI